MYPFKKFTVAVSLPPRNAMHVYFCVSSRFLLKLYLFIKLMVQLLTLSAHPLLFACFFFLPCPSEWGSEEVVDMLLVHLAIQRQAEMQ